MAWLQNGLTILTTLNSLGVDALSIDVSIFFKMVGHVDQVVHAAWYVCPEFAAVQMPSRV